MKRLATLIEARGRVKGIAGRFVDIAEIGCYRPLRVDQAPLLLPHHRRKSLSAC
jgi:hypothetical protein